MDEQIKEIIEITARLENALIEFEGNESESLAEKVAEEYIAEKDDTFYDDSTEDEGGDEEGL